MRAVQCFTVYTYKIEQNGALQFKNNGEKVPVSLHQAYTFIQNSPQFGPFQSKYRCTTDFLLN